jgi:hypothetical protein
MATVHYPCNLRSSERQSSSLQLFKSKESVFSNPRDAIRRTEGLELNHPDG